MPKETKKQKFNRIKPLRLDNFIISLDRLSKVGNSYQFECTDEEKQELFDEVDKQVSIFKSKF